MTKAKGTVLYGSGGYYVEWYRDDDNNSGYGANPQCARWYGTQAECLAMAKTGKPVAGTKWRPSSTAIDEAALEEGCRFERAFGDRSEF